MLLHGLKEVISEETTAVPPPLMLLKPPMTPPMTPPSLLGKCGEAEVALGLFLAAQDASKWSLVLSSNSYLDQSELPETVEGRVAGGGGRRVGWSGGTEEEGRTPPQNKAMLACAEGGSRGEP